LGEATALPVGSDGLSRRINGVDLVSAVLRFKRQKERKESREKGKESRQAEQSERSEEVSVAESLIHGSASPIALLDSARCTITLKLMLTVRIG
jgi:dephospho-CoA kinase